MGYLGKNKSRLVLFVEIRQFFLILFLLFYLQGFVSMVQLEEILKECQTHGQVSGYGSPIDPT